MKSGHGVNDSECFVSQRCLLAASGYDCGQMTGDIIRSAEHICTSGFASGILEEITDS
jgi:hypothetical protein